MHSMQGWRGSQPLKHGPPRQNQTITKFYSKPSPRNDDLRVEQTKLMTSAAGYPQQKSRRLGTVNHSRRQETAKPVRSSLQSEHLRQSHRQLVTCKKNAEPPNLEATLDAKPLGGGTAAIDPSNNIVVSPNRSQNAYTSFAWLKHQEARKRQLRNSLTKLPNKSPDGSSRPRISTNRGSPSKLHLAYEAKRKDSRPTELCFVQRKQITVKNQVESEATLQTFKQQCDQILSVQNGLGSQEAQVAVNEMQQQQVVLMAPQIRPSLKFVTASSEELSSASAINKPIGIDGRVVSEDGRRQSEKTGARSVAGKKLSVKINLRGNDEGSNPGSGRSQKSFDTMRRQMLSMQCVSVEGVSSAKTLHMASQQASHSSTRAPSCNRAEKQANVNVLSLVNQQRRAMKQTAALGKAYLTQQRRKGAHDMRVSSKLNEFEKQLFKSKVKLTMRDKTDVLKVNNAKPQARAINDEKDFQVRLVSQGDHTESGTVSPKRNRVGSQREILEEKAFNQGPHGHGNQGKDQECQISTQKSHSESSSMQVMTVLEDLQQVEKHFLKEINGNQDTSGTNVIRYQVPYSKCLEKIVIQRFPSPRKKLDQFTQPAPTLHTARNSNHNEQFLLRQMDLKSFERQGCLEGKKAQLHHQSPRGYSARKHGTRVSQDTHFQLAQPKQSSPRAELLIYRKNSGNTFQMKQVHPNSEIGSILDIQTQQLSSEVQKGGSGASKLLVDSKAYNKSSSQNLDLLQLAQTSEKNYTGACDAPDDKGKRRTSIYSPLINSGDPQAKYIQAAANTVHEIEQPQSMFKVFSLTSKINRVESISVTKTGRPHIQQGQGSISVGSRANSYGRSRPKTSKGPTLQPTPRQEPTQVTLGVTSPPERQLKSKQQYISSHRKKAQNSPQRDWKLQRPFLFNFPLQGSPSSRGISGTVPQGIQSLVQIASINKYQNPPSPRLAEEEPQRADPRKHETRDVAEVIAESTPTLSENPLSTLQQKQIDLQIKRTVNPGDQHSTVNSKETPSIGKRKGQQQPKQNLFQHVFNFPSERSQTKKDSSCQTSTMVRSAREHLQQRDKTLNKMRTQDQQLDLLQKILTKGQKQVNGQRRNKHRAHSSTKHQLYLTCLDLNSRSGDNSVAPASGQTSTQMAVGFPQTQDTLTSGNGGKRVIKLTQEGDGGALHTFGTVPYDFYGQNQSEEEDDEEHDQTQICTSLQSSLVQNQHQQQAPPQH